MYNDSFLAVTFRGSLWLNCVGRHEAKEPSQTSAAESGSTSETLCQHRTYNSHTSDGTQCLGFVHHDSMSSSNGDSVSDNNRTASTTCLVDSLQEACAHGRTEEAKKILDRWKSMSNPVPRRPPKRPMVHLHSALHAAVQHDHLSTVSMLLDEGFCISYQEVRPALANRSMAMLQVFLNHGWNINQTLGPSMAPALT